MKTYRKKRSIIYKMPDEEFAKIVQSSNTLGKILSHFGLQNKGGNSHTVKSRIKQLNLDISHIPLGVSCNKGRKFQNFKIPLVDILTINSHYTRKQLKKRLIEESILINECSICNMQPIWVNKPLVLVLDHINGDPIDNRIENLRLVCPNCNSQTSTFAGRNRKHVEKIECPPSICPLCGNLKKNSKSKQCVSCSNKNRRKVQRPDTQILIEDVHLLGYVQTGKKYGVSDNAIRKWLTVL